jgi:hypothetical protein
MTDANPTWCAGCTPDNCHGCQLPAFDGERFTDAAPVRGFLKNAGYDIEPAEDLAARMMSTARAYANAWRQVQAALNFAFPNWTANGRNEVEAAVYTIEHCRRPFVAASPDANVERVRDMLRERSVVGLQKYGVTTERDDLSRVEWLRHLQLELLDGAVYIEAAIKHDTKGTS